MKSVFKPWCARLVAACAIALAVWALRVALVGELGTGIPFWDQWDREGLIIYEPWLQGQLSWRAIFEPHLEHRIVWTHLWNLGIFELCGQWDPMVQMVAQALIPAVTAGFCVWGLLAARMEWYWRGAVLLGALIAFGAPYAFSNCLWGFQSQFGFLVALSLLGCAATAFAWRQTRYRWLALLAGLAAPLAMGAGALAGPVIIVLTIVVILTGKKLSRASGQMLVIGVICFLWGGLWRSDSTVMLFARVESMARFGQVWMAALAWPNCQISWLAVLAGLPVALLVVQVVRREITAQPHVLFLIGMAVWAAGCAAGGAWTRGGVDPTPPSRYCDFLTLWCWANLLSLVLVVRSWLERSQAQWRILALVLASAWGGATLYGGVSLLEEFFIFQRPAIQASSGRHLEAVNSVLGGSSVAVMIGAGLQNRPEVIAKVMTSQILAPFLPPELQSPPRDITADGELAMGVDGPHAEWKWQSGIFSVRKSAMLMLVRGETDGLQLTLVDCSDQSKISFHPSGRHIGEWSEWLARTAPGPHQVRIEAGPSSGALAFIHPRPVSAPGYWMRSGILNFRWLCGAAVLCLALALWVWQRSCANLYDALMSSLAPS